MKNKLSRAVHAALVAVLLAAAPVLATDQAPDPVAENLFPPELVVQSQAEIQLSDSQRDALKAEVLKAQGRFQPLQWDLQAEMGKLVTLLKADRPDEGKVLAQLKSVLDLEREIKSTQIGLLVRVKNLLTKEQQARLSEIRARRR